MDGLDSRECSVCVLPALASTRVCRSLATHTPAASIVAQASRVWAPGGFVALRGGRAGGTEARIRCRKICCRCVKGVRWITSTGQAKTRCAEAQADGGVRARIDQGRGAGTQGSSCWGRNKGTIIRTRRRVGMKGCQRRGGGGWAYLGEHARVSRECKGQSLVCKHNTAQHTDPPIIRRCLSKLRILHYLTSPIWDIYVYINIYTYIYRHIYPTYPSWRRRAPC